MLPFYSTQKTMDENLKELGVGAILITMVMKEMFGFLKNRKESSDDSSSIEAYKKVASDSRLEAAITSLKENMVKQTTILERMQQDHSELLSLTRRSK